MTHKSDSNDCEKDVEQQNIIGWIRSVRKQCTSDVVLVGGKGLNCAE